MRAFRVLMVLAIVATLSPLISMAAAEAIAWWYRCELAVESVKPCLAGGEDMGRSLHTLVSMGWFLFVTLPVFLGVVALWIVVELLRWLRQRRSPKPVG